jgi:cell division protein ZapE
MLMDMFFGSLPEGEGKKRFHYHDFMGKVHEGFTVLRKGGEDGLAMEEVVDGLLGGECSVLCLDEMEIVDITDAMIIRRVFEVIVSRRISLVMTSNVAPVDLYKHGLQRELFEPFIDVLVGYVDVMDLGGDKDYRLVGEEREALCFVRGEEGLLESVYEGWDFCEGIDEVYLGLSSRGRGLLAKRRDGDKVWLKFDDVCGGFLGSRDYVKLSREFGKFVIEGVPKMSDVGIDRVRRFVMLIDVLYEERVSLALLLDGDLSLREVMMLEEGDRYGLGRAYSRLEEMLSGGYG